MSEVKFTTDVVQHSGMHHHIACPVRDCRYSPDTWNEWRDCGDHYIAGYKAAQDAAALTGGSGHRTAEPHDCFLMQCHRLGEDVRRLQNRLAMSVVDARAVYAVLDAAAWVVAAGDEDEGGEWDLSHEELRQAIERLEKAEGWSRKRLSTTP